MNSINKQALKMYNVTEKDFRDWCKRHHKNTNKSESRREFFRLLQEGKSIKD